MIITETDYDYIIIGTHKVLNFLEDNGFVTCASLSYTKYLYFLIKDNYFYPFRINDKIIKSKLISIDDLKVKIRIKKLERILDEK